MSCCVPRCKSNRETSKITLYPFPSDYELCAQWARNCVNADWWPDSFSRVCNKHFLTQPPLASDLPWKSYLGIKSHVKPHACHTVIRPQDNEMIRLATYMMDNSYDFNTFQNPPIGSGVQQFHHDFVKNAPSYFKNKWRELISRHVMRPNFSARVVEDAPPYMKYMNHILKCADNILTKVFLCDFDPVVVELARQVPKGAAIELALRYHTTAFKIQRIWELLCAHARMKLRWLSSRGDIPAKLPSTCTVMTHAEATCTADAIAHHAHVKNMMVYTIGDGPLRRLIWLVRRYGLENHPFRLRAWVTAYRRYTRDDRWCPFILFQRRWHQLKEEARIALNSALAPELGVKGFALTPHPLHWIIAVRWPHILTDPLPSWNQLMQLGLVYNLEDSELDQVESIDPVDEGDDRDYFLELATEERLKEIRKMLKADKGNEIYLHYVHTLFSSAKSNYTQPTIHNTNHTPPSDSVVKNKTEEVDFTSNAEVTISHNDVSHSVLKDLETINPDKAQATIIFESDDESLSGNEDTPHNHIKGEKHSDDDIEMEVRYPLDVTSLQKSHLKFQNDSDEDFLPLSLLNSTKECDNQSYDGGDRDDCRVKKKTALICSQLDDLNRIKKENNSDSPVKFNNSVRIMFEEDMDVMDARLSDAVEATDRCTVDRKSVVETRTVPERVDRSLSQSVPSSMSGRVEDLLRFCRPVSVVLEKIPGLETARYSCDTLCRPVSLPQGGFPRCIPVAEVKPLLCNPGSYLYQTPTLKNEPVTSPPLITLIRNDTLEGGVCSGEQLADMIQDEIYRVLHKKSKQCCTARILCVKSSKPHYGRNMRGIRSCCSWLLRESPPSAASMQRADNRLKRLLEGLRITPINTKISNNNEESDNSSSENDTGQLVIDEPTLNEKRSNKNAKPLTIITIPHKIDAINSYNSKKSRKRNIHFHQPLKKKKQQLKEPVNNDNTSIEDDQETALQEWMRQKNEFKKYFTIKPISPVKNKTEDGTPTTNKTVNSTNNYKKPNIDKATNLTKNINVMNITDLKQVVEPTEEENLINEPKTNNEAVTHLSSPKDKAIQTNFAEPTENVGLPVESSKSNKVALTKEVVTLNDERVVLKEPKIPTILSNPLRYIADMMQKDPIKVFVMENENQTKIMITKNEPAIPEMSEDITRRNAQNCKNYRERIKSANQGVVKKKKTNSEYCRMYRQRKKLLAQELQSENEVLHTPSTSSLQMTFEPHPNTTDNNNCRTSAVNPLEDSVITTKTLPFNNGTETIVLDEHEQSDDDVICVKKPASVDNEPKHDNNTGNELMEKEIDRTFVNANEDNRYIDEIKELTKPETMEDDDSDTEAMVIDENVSYDDIGDHIVGIDENLEKPTFINTENNVITEPAFVDVNESHDDDEICDRPVANSFGTTEENTAELDKFTVNVFSRDPKTDLFEIMTTNKISCNRTTSSNKAPHAKKVVKTYSRQNKKNICQAIEKEKQVVRGLPMKISTVTNSSSLPSHGTADSGAISRFNIIISPVPKH